MTHETDLPCSDCGVELIEKTITLEEAEATETGAQVIVAECPSCGARYYPRESLARLSTDPNGHRPKADS